MEEKEVSNITLGFMVAVALFFDALQALVEIIPGLGQLLSVLIDFFALGTFFLWGKIAGFKLAKWKRGGVLALGFFIELIPIINIIPAWTVSVVIFALDIKAKKLLSNVPGGKVVGHSGNASDTDIRRAA